jgi:putative OPT family oligopeptide transporter
MREFSLLAIFLGVIIGIIFGAANAYIGLKVGMTVSASIPAAVISMALLRGLLRRGNIRENNIVQTVGSVGESLAAGMIFVIPAFFILAINNPVDPPSYWEIVIWSTLGGLLGVLFMVPPATHADRPRARETPLPRRHRLRRSARIR